LKRWHPPYRRRRRRCGAISRDHCINEGSPTGLVSSRRNLAVPGVGARYRVGQGQTAASVRRRASVSVRRGATRRPLPIRRFRLESLVTSTHVWRVDDGIILRWNCDRDALVQLDRIGAHLYRTGVGGKDPAYRLRHRLAIRVAENICCTSRRATSHVPRQLPAVVIFGHRWASAHPTLPTLYDRMPRSAAAPATTGMTLSRGQSLTVTF
jgi:hypothetical protein